MKRQYILPTMEVVSIHQNTSLLAGSVQGTISDETTDKAYSRGFDFSEDYDFDEE